MPQMNQHKPLVPDEEIQDHAKRYWDMGLSDEKIVEHLHDHFDTAKYGLSTVSFRRMRRRWGWQSTQKQKHTPDSIRPILQEIRRKFPKMGARQMRGYLRQDYGMKVSEKVLQDLFHQDEPDEVLQRKARRFKRQRFWAAGCNDIWAMDQHDKWQRFGLRLHVGLDPFSGYVLWVKIWWTNRNPRLINSFYLEAARGMGGVCLVTQSDLGTENNGVANMHTLIRQGLDAQLQGTLQHRWMGEKQNVKPEIQWMLYRRTFAPGFEDVLDHGVNEGLYNPNDVLQRLLFHWIFIPWLQHEIDQWRRRFNTTARRKNRNKVIPQGVPELIRSKPERFNALDFKVHVPPELFDEMEQRWAPPDDPVFQLVPPEFNEQATTLYAAMGRPLISFENVWEVYVAMHHALMQLGVQLPWETLLQDFVEQTEDVPLLLGQENLPFGSEGMDQLGYLYLGGLQVPPALDDQVEDEIGGIRIFADFSDTESNSPGTR